MKKFGMTFACTLILLVLLTIFAVPQVQAADRCWTSKSSYTVGETVTIYASLEKTASYHLRVWRGGAFVAGPDLGQGPGTKHVTVTADAPAGQRMVQIYPVGDLTHSAYCYFTVTGGGGGGGGVDRCWTSKSSYAVGETVTIYATMTHSASYYVSVRNPVGAVTTYNLGYVSSPPKTTYVTGTAALPTGQRTVQLKNSLGQIMATCYFTVTGGGGGGGGGGVDRCWTSKSTYAVGETGTIYASLSKTNVQYVLYVVKPGGSYTTYNLGYGPGTKSVTGTVSTPTGQWTVRLYNSLGQSVYCYFTVTGGGGGGGGGYSVTVYAKLYPTGAALQGANVYLDGTYVGLTGSGGILIIQGVSSGYHTIRCTLWYGGPWIGGSKNVYVYSSGYVIIYLQ